ncbi:hypothetical protein DACRYDRAFT_22167 [Dacryopinax primogenitus]|uniref:Uncharacterized protein n=1 Tax=Dacryopinax primogenitus (strain DJM 731) TaxID=1858805 RepID=M5G0U7_DACPD|nr:uncharacterized protein DACRYDRAFT_22167 [Dacryopinax primogenitus]EJU01755.1 hypothetical protein DACRYDRAFT_22167 [Dacryopinax primogenitus]
MLKRYLTVIRFHRILHQNTGVAYAERLEKKQMGKMQDGIAVEIIPVFSIPCLRASQTASF